MGYDESLFVDSIINEFKCSICCDVLEDPQTLASCDHVFCAPCIHNTMSYKLECPICRQKIDATNQPKPSLRQFRESINSFKIRCPFKWCSVIVRLEQWQKHCDQCERNPENKPNDCPRLCGAKITRNQTDHNCLLYMEALHHQRQIDYIRRLNGWHLIVLTVTLTLVAMKCHWSLIVLWLLGNLIFIVRQMLDI